MSRHLVPLLLVSLCLLVVAACGAGSAGSNSTEDSNQPAPEPPEPSLSHCPKEMPELSGGSPGAKGDVVIKAASSAVLCRWRVEKDGSFVGAERLVHRRALAPLSAALNFLRPGEAGEFECESGINLWYLIGFHFPDDSGTEVEVDYSACGAVRTRRHFWGVDDGLAERLDALIDR
jgi:hypothetical protein